MVESVKVSPDSDMDADGDTEKIEPSDLVFKMLIILLEIGMSVV